ncbi:MAG: hypothetical protein C4531_02610 [Desulfurivibrio sp.]|nr:MAG: hypothetical protein C4531_02610 [Desulfurivibrio sp.]
MSVSSSQLANEFEEIKSRFSASPYIRITATAGNPPESYEITYRVKGISQVAGGQAVMVDKHRVSIVLPFGYPHFPPNCKPLTPIFHPDFDPDAVCIGDFWNSSHSLAELIVHIGRLISYQTYGREDVFNREALEWTLAHGELLPLDRADFSLQTPEPQQSVAAAADQAASSPDLTTPAAAGQPPPASAPAAGRRQKPGRAAAAGKMPAGLNRKLLLTIVCGVVLLAAAAGALLVLDLRHYQGAVQKWAGVAALVKEGNYPEAEAQVKAVQVLLDKLRFLKKGEKQALLQEVGKLTDSREFKEGLQGRILVKGRYISVGQLQEINAVNGLLARARELADAGKWQESDQTYARAAEKTAALGELAPLPLDQLEALSAKSRLQGRLEAARQFRSRHQWEQAQGNLQEAMAVLAGLPQDEQQEAAGNEIRTMMTEVAFAAAVARGDQLFADRQWSQAADSYESALQQTQGQGGELAPQAAKIAGQRDVARFNFFYEEGLQDFSQGRWDAASANLQKSEALLAAARAAGGARDISQEMIRRKSVTATVKAREGAVTAYVAEENYSRAVKELEAMINAIDRGQLGADREFAAARQSAAESIGRYRFLDDIQQKIAFLLSRYEAIFKDFFPSAARSKLSDPRISFVRQEGRLLIFRMQCLEESRRQKFTLEMHYQYDTGAKQWSPRPVAEAPAAAGK